MADVVKINQIERQLILYDLFTSLEVITYGDIRFVLGKVEKRTLQRDLRDLTAAGLLSVKYSKQEQGYIHNKEEDTPKEMLNDKISEKKRTHLKRLQRVAECMKLVVETDPVAAYHERFPGSSERMRKRDFETLRHIGFWSGYDWERGGYVLDRNDAGYLDGYGVFLRDGKMVRYR